MSIGGRLGVFDMRTRGRWVIFHVRSSHLSHKLVKERRTTIGEDAVHQAVDAIDERCARWPVAARVDWPLWRGVGTE